MELLIGADPEVFAFKDGKAVSAHGLVKGDKQNPFKVDKGAIQVDGMALEFNIDPAKNADEFVENITTVMNILAGEVPDLELRAVPTATFSRKILDAQPLEALILGCEPDFNAYNGGRANPTPNAKDVNFRTGAGHIHIGWGENIPIDDPSHIEACCHFAKELDFALAVPAMKFDSDTKRRHLYGKAGCFRPKSYGMEYRTLSNAWLAHPDLIRWVYSNTQLAFSRLLKQRSTKYQVHYNAQPVINNPGHRVTQPIEDYIGWAGYKMPPRRFYV